MLEKFQTEQVATVFLVLALVHTFSVSYVAKLADSFQRQSFINKLLHALAEVEIVFGFWAILFLITWSFFESVEKVLTFSKNLNVTEPLFILCIVLIASAKPVIDFTQLFIVNSANKISNLFRINHVRTQFLVLFIVGPLLGSLITEPAAITIVGLILIRMFNEKITETYFVYGLTALLFVNISIGGTLTSYAAPPVLMVAATWNWDR